MNETEILSQLATSIQGDNMKQMLTVVLLTIIAAGYVAEKSIRWYQARRSQVPALGTSVTTFSPDSLQAHKVALETITKVEEMVKDGNAVILQKDGYGQNALLNIPRWLKELTDAMQRMEMHTEKMVNHQSDVLIEIARMAKEEATEGAAMRARLDVLIAALQKS